MVHLTVTAVFLESCRGNITIVERHQVVFASLGNPGIVVDIEGVLFCTVEGNGLTFGGLVVNSERFVIPDEWNIQALD